MRDEYDRLDKILRQNKNKDGQHGGEESGSGSSRRPHKHHHNHHHHEDGEECEEGEEEEEEEEDGGECCSCNRSGGEEECDSGDEDDDYCDDENCDCCGAEDSNPCDNSKEAAGANDAVPPIADSNGRVHYPGSGGTSQGGNSAKLREHLHVNFDHLSIVSEENLTGSDGSNSVHNLPADQDLDAHYNSLTVPPRGPAKDGKDSAYSAHHSSPAIMSLMSLPATPCSPLLNEFQSLVPPLTHFENINYDDIKPLPQTSSSSRYHSSSSSSTSSSALVQSSSFVCKASAHSAVAAAAIASPPPPSSSLSATLSKAACLFTTDDVPSVAPSPEPPDSSGRTSSPSAPAPTSSTSLSSLPIVLASSVSSSDWMWNNKTVSFSTFRPPAASSVSQPCLSAAPKNQPQSRKCDNVPREEGEIVPINPMPRHFFSPLRSRQNIMLLPSTPDLYVHDVLASPGGSSTSLNAMTTTVVVEPIYSTIHKSRPSYPLSITCSPIGAIDNPLYASQTSPMMKLTSSGSYVNVMNPIAGPAADGASRGSPRSPAAFQVSGVLFQFEFLLYIRSVSLAFQVGGNLDELLQEIEGMAEDVAQIDLNSPSSAHEGRPDRGAPLNCCSYSPSSNPALHKTFRSELNLLLIRPSDPSVDSGGKRLLTAPPVHNSATVGQSSSDLTPPPNLPEPMNLLPATLPYLDFKSNTAVITTPQAALANRRAENGGATPTLPALTTVTSVVSKPISSATAVRKKLFGKKNKEPIINEPECDDAVPLKITIPATDAATHPHSLTAEDKVGAAGQSGSGSNGHAQAKVSYSSAYALS